MRMNYVVLGAIFTIFGLATLMVAGGLVNIEIEDDDFEDEFSVSASFGLASVLGWATFLVGAVLLVIGLVAGPPYEKFEAD